MISSPTSLALSEARRHLKMNLSILEMLKGNTEPGDLARLRRLWVSPYEERIEELEKVNGGPGEESRQGKEARSGQ